MKRGFTLLEVMVAVAILGLGLTAILSAQAGAFSAAAHARNLSIATSLARCKMGEIEEKLGQVDGWPELEEIDSGACCDGDTTPNLRCSWKIEKPEFPEPKPGELNLDTGLDLSSPAGAASGSPGGAAGALGPLGGLLGLPGGATDVPPPTGEGEGLGDIAGALGGMGGAEALSGMLGMVGTFVYPSLKSIFETNTRRVTLTVTWTEGKKEYSFDVVQWVTNPNPGLASNELVDAATGGGGLGGTGGPNQPGGGTGFGSGFGSGMGQGSGMGGPRGGTPK